MSFGESFVPTQSGVLVPSSVLAALEKSFTAAGQLIVGTGNGTGELLATGTAGQMLTVGGADPSGLQWAIPPTDTQFGSVPTSTGLAATAPRYAVSLNTQSFAGGSGTGAFSPTYLYAGQVIGHLAWLSGSTPATGPTHQWLVITDSAGNMQALTADQTTAAIAANTLYAYPIATISTGASATWTVPTSGLYYLGVMVTVTTTMPTYSGPASPLAAIATPTPSIAVSDLGGYTTPPAFPHQFTFSTEGGHVVWIEARS